MPLMGYRDSGGHFAVRYVPAFGGWRGKPGRIGRIGRTGRRGGGLSGRSPPEQHPPAQFHVSRARHDRRMRESSTGGDGTTHFSSPELSSSIISSRNKSKIMHYINTRAEHEERVVEKTTAEKAAHPGRCRERRERI